MTARQCIRQSKRTHQRCRDHAMRGQEVCYHHGGASPQARRKAAERLTLEAEYQAHPTRTPAEQLVEAGNRSHFLMTKAWREVDTNAPTVDTVRALAEHLDRVARFSRMNLDAGTAERQTRVQEATVELLFVALERVASRLDLTPAQRATWTVAVPEELQRAELEDGGGRG